MTLSQDHVAVDVASDMNVRKRSYDGPMVLLGRASLLVSCWGAVILVWGYVPGLHPLPGVALELTVIIAGAIVLLVLVILRTSRWGYGPLVLWRHRPQWWRATTLGALAAIATTTATQTVLPALAHQRTSDVYAIAFACVAAPVAAAYRSADAVMSR
jgi:hypothetical protein